MRNRHFSLVALATLAVVGGSFHVAAAAADKAKENEVNEQKVAIKDVPKAVRKALKREAKGEKIETVDKEQRDGKTVYEADAKVDGHNYEIVVDAKGVLLSKTLDEGEGEGEKAGVSDRKVGEKDGAAAAQEKPKAKAAKKAKKQEKGEKAERGEAGEKN